MALLHYSMCWFGLCLALLVVIVVSPLCCSCHCRHAGSHSSSCFPALFLLPPRVGLGCMCPPHIGLGGNPPLPLCVWPNPPPLPLRVGLRLIRRRQPPFIVPCLSPLRLIFLALAVTVCVPVDHRGWGGCRFVRGGVAVVVAAFANSPAFAYITVGHYLLFLGPLIPRGGRPVTGVGFDLLALVFVGGIHHPPPHSLTPPPPCRLAGPPACLAPLPPLPPTSLAPPSPAPRPSLSSHPSSVSPLLPPHLPPSLDPPSSKTKLPTSLWKGEGWLGLHPRFWGRAEAVLKEPTPLNRGEGLVASSMGEFGGVEGEGGGGGRREWAKSTMMRLMCISNSARPTKIAVDIRDCMSDNRIKSCIILYIF